MPLKQVSFKKSFIKRNNLVRNQVDEKTQKAKEFPIENMCPTSLKKTGKVLMGCCPFHTEHSPSFAVYPTTNTWNCFAGCGGGDAISFYMKLKNVGFAQAVEELQ